MDEEKVIKAAEPKSVSGKKFIVTSRQNRSIEIHLRKNILHFFANETKILTDNQINSPAFQQQINYFSLKEV